MNIDKKFIVNLQGKEFVTYEGLLDLAHKKGLISIEVELLQVPNKDNDMIAIAKATAKTEKGTFVDIGDAGPGSVNRMISPHIIRMASTRAKARALRDLTNIGMTAVEELAEEPEEPINNNRHDKKRHIRAKSKDGGNQNKDSQRGVNKLSCTECDAEITQNVANYSRQYFGKQLCMNCQKKFKQAN